MINHYFTRAVLSDEGVRSQAVGQGGIYGFHKMVWNLFPGISVGERPFLYHVEEGNRRTVYCVSSVMPSDEKGFWHIETKPYEPEISDGTLLRFRIHINPTISSDKTGKQHRHDVVMYTKKKNKDAGKQINMTDIINESVSAWLIRKGNLNGFEIDSKTLSISSYRRNEVYRNEKSSIVFSTVDVDGILIVKDSIRFKDALFNGIGSCKGFGCGLLMVRKV